MTINYASNLQISTQTSDELGNQFTFNDNMIKECNSNIAKADDANDIYATINKLMNFQSQILTRQNSNKPQEKQISYDNQTVISTSSVRRKDENAKKTI